MKRSMAMLLIAGLLFTGCAKKEAAVAEPANNAVAKKLLVEGTVYLKQGDIKNAVGSFATAIKAAPGDFEGYFMLSETFVHLKQYPQAISVLSTAARQFPDNGLAYYLLAVAHEGAGQDMPAIQAARRSVEIFNAKQDQDGVKRAAVLLAGLVQAAKQKSEDAATANAAADAQKALDAVPVSAQPAVPAGQ
ncbi:MAG: tetratricopeptide repeat protein [Candidatus Omnitrophica bacterium]|nr:tetratricopeptide repeat protein [Candidatus Omnitrophota bacterium]